MSEPEPTSAPLQWDVERLRRRVGGDEALVRVLVSTLIENWPSMLTDLRRHLQERDARLLERAAHTVKGAAANLEASLLRDLSLQIEGLAKERKFDEAEQVVGRLAAAFEEFERVAGVW